MSVGFSNPTPRLLFGQHGLINGILSDTGIRTTALLLPVPFIETTKYMANQKKYFCYLYYLYVILSILFNILNFKNNIGASIVSSYLILLSLFFFRRIKTNADEQSMNIRKFETVLIALNISLFLAFIIDIEHYKAFVLPILILSPPSVFFIFMTKKIFSAGSSA